MQNDDDWFELEGPTPEELNEVERAEMEAFNWKADDEFHPAKRTECVEQHAAWMLRRLERGEKIPDEDEQYVDYCGLVEATRLRHLDQYPPELVVRVEKADRAVEVAMAVHRLEEATGVLEWVGSLSDEPITFDCEELCQWVSYCGECLAMVRDMNTAQATRTLQCVQRGGDVPKRSRIVREVDDQVDGLARLEYARTGRPL